MLVLRAAKKQDGASPGNSETALFSTSPTIPHFRLPLNVATNPGTSIIYHMEPGIVSFLKMHRREEEAMLPSCLWC